MKPFVVAKVGQDGAGKVWLTIKLTKTPLLSSSRPRSSSIVPWFFRGVYWSDHYPNTPYMLYMPTLTPKPPQCRHIWHTWRVWVMRSPLKDAPKLIPDASVDTN